jgi:hypothetical protein
VEAAQGDLGHSSPSVNVPFPNTREMFLLKLGLSGAERASFIAASPDERRAFLDGSLARRSIDNLDVLSFNDPVDVDTLEWFASPDDLCRALVALDSSARQPGGAPVRDILGVNPGLDVDSDTFRYVGFKGGSEPGVVALAWLLERSDHRRFVLIAAAVDPRAPLDQAVVPTVAEGIRLLTDA